MNRKTLDLASSRTWYQKENRASVTICSLSLIVLGIMMIFAGGLITFIYYTEITPPNYDAYYQRYVGSSLPRVLGILILMAGITLFLASSIFLVFAYYRGNSKPQQSRFYYESPLPTLSAYESSNVKESYIG